MIRFIVRTVLAALLASGWNSAQAATVELAATGQFEVQGAEVHRSLQPPAAFLVSPSPFGRPVFITTGPLGARLLAPARISRDDADPEIVRVDTGGSQEDYLSVRSEGQDLIVARDGLTMTLKASPPLLGDRTMDEVVRALPEYRRGAARYTPDPALLEDLRRMTQPTELFVIFGSWCPHCEAMIPRLVRVLQDVKGAPLTVTLHGVPPGGARDAVADELRITGLPTVIVRRDGKEFARIEGDELAAPEKRLVALVGPSARPAGGTPRP